MNRLTKQISLVLISSSLILHGCHQPRPDEEKEKDRDRPATTTHTSGRGPMFFHGGGSGASSRPAASTGSSVRGGFGSSAHAVST